MFVKQSEHTEKRRKPEVGYFFNFYFHEKNFIHFSHCHIIFD